MYGETEAVRLSWLMVGILTNNNHLHLMKGAEIESIENESARRITRAAPIFLTYSSSQLLEIGLLKLFQQMFLPSGFYLHVHTFSTFCLQN